MDVENVSHSLRWRLKPWTLGLRAYKKGRVPKRAPQRRRFLPFSHRYRAFVGFASLKLGRNSIYWYLYERPVYLRKPMFEAFKLTRKAKVMPVASSRNSKLRFRH
jgi:hypothetical protein